MKELPKDLPEHLHQEYQKYLDNPEKYKKLYPVLYKTLQRYAEDQDEKDQE